MKLDNDCIFSTLLPCNLNAIFKVHQNKQINKHIRYIIFMEIIM